MEEMFMERLKRAEADFEQKLRLVEERWEARWLRAQVRCWDLHTYVPVLT